MLPAPGDVGAGMNLCPPSLCHEGHWYHVSITLVEVAWTLSLDIHGRSNDNTYMSESLEMYLSIVWPFLCFCPSVR
jgi:hypothetical protein